MRILAICSSHALDDDRVTLKQAVSLAKLGHEVIVCARAGKQTSIPQVKLLDIDVHPDLRKFSIISKILGNGERKTRVARLPRLYEKVKLLKPDLVVCHEFETALLALIIKKTMGTPFVFDCHEFYNETVAGAFAGYIRPLIRNITEFILKLVARNAELVTVVSPAHKDFFQRIAPDTPVDILYNSPILDYFPYNEEDTIPVTVVHEGRLSASRGAMLILQAIALVKKQIDVRFLVLGAVEDSIRDDFLREVSRLGLKDSISMPGRLPWTEFGKVESTGQIGLICMQPSPNNMLGLSNKLFTYMACGLAIIGMKGSETERMIDAYRIGVTADSTNPQEIAERIVFLANNPDERKKMARNGRRAIENDLGWHRMEEKMRLLYSVLETRLKD